MARSPSGARSLWVLLFVAVAAAVAAAAREPAPFLTGNGEDIRDVLERRVPSVSDSLPPRADARRVNETSFFLPMRDGVELWTVVTVPEGVGRVGAVLERCAYGTGSCSAYI